MKNDSNNVEFVPVAELRSRIDGVFRSVRVDASACADTTELRRWVVGARRLSAELERTASKRASARDKARREEALRACAERIARVEAGEERTRVTGRTIPPVERIDA